MGCVAADHLPLFAFADAGDADGQARHGGGCVAAYQIHSVVVARQPYACVELLHVLHGESFGDAEGDGYLFGFTVHGADVGDVDDRRFVA